MPQGQVSGIVLAAIHLLLAAAASPPLSSTEVAVPAGSYYVGKAMGVRDYRALANASTPGFLVMRGEVTQRLLDEAIAWGTLHGYVFDTGCTNCDRSQPDRPAAGVSWREAALCANALSERNGLDPVYRDKAGQPLRSIVPPEGMDHVVIEPTLTGYRLPTIPEWQIALRGGDRALADGSYGATGRATNALGLIDIADAHAEWTASSMDLGDSARSFFACNEKVDGRAKLDHCGLHGAGFLDETIAFRLVRKAGR